MSWKLLGIVSAAFALLLAAFFGYYKYAEARHEADIQKIASYKSAVDAQKKAIDSIQKNFEEQKKELEALQKGNSDAETQLNDFRNNLDATGLEKLSREDPAKAEETINDQIKNLFDSIESITR